MKRINPNGVAALAKDVRYLTEFVDTLGNPILGQNLEELQQTVALMQSDNSEEFYDVSTRNKKYGRVDAMNGPILLEKYVHIDLVANALNLASATDAERLGSHILCKVLQRRTNSQPYRRDLELSPEIAHSGFDVWLWLIILESGMRPSLRYGLPL